MSLACVKPARATAALAGRLARGRLAACAVALLWGFLPTGPSFSAEPTADDLRFFETSVRPLLIEHCQKCHGPEKQWSNLRLDSRAALEKGGDLGLVIVPGNPAESRLIRAVKYDDAALQMPPDGRLDDAQVA